MKLKLKNKSQQVEQKQSNNSSQLTKNSSWEMSAQDALRVDYVTRKHNFPLNQH
jgi:hypothetical protein